LATILWFSGVESGGLGEFTQLDAGGNHSTVCNTSQPGCSTATCTNLLIPPTNAHGGCYSIGAIGGISNSGFFVGKKALNLSTVYTRMYFFNANTSPKLINEPIFASLTAAQAAINTLYLKSDNKLKWCFGSVSSGCTAIATGTTVLPDQTWILLETKQVIDPVVGGMEVKINGIVEFTSFGTNTSGNNIDQFIYGPFTNDNNNAYYYLFDDLALSDSSYIGPGAVLARQGAAGTPTYDTWTKNSCTGGVIDGCWSDTPFSASSNASSSTSGNAQTMLVSTFSATQTGHGSEAVTGISTVNFCTTAIVAKGASGTPSLKIRRRPSGSDIDTTIALATSDVFYTDGVWTPSLSDLLGSTMEVGVIQNQNTVSETVEDVWQMCDVLIPPTPTGRVKHRTIME
jgi:hypothetical protein